MNPLGAPSNEKYGFTDAERKYLSMKKIAEKKDYRLAWIIALLVLTFVIYWFVDRPLKVEAQSTNETCQQYLTK